MLEPHCPWYNISKMAPPNVKWCEASMCSIITEPANTWSNLAYLILTIWVWRQTKNMEDKTLKSFVPAFFLMGLFSFVYHASYNFFTQWFDFLGMFLMIGLFAALNLRRMGKLKQTGIWPFYFAFNALFGALTIIFYLTYVPIQSIVLIQALFLIFSELRLRSLEKGTNYKYFYISIVFIASAATFSVLDVTRTMCDPHNHFFQGHATWHLLSAISVAFAFKFYSQFNYEGMTNENSLTDPNSSPPIT
ncbi:MAG: ceramidase domain-containing protein [Bacteriovoracaceae bacterium]|nr:ceramidase domain-containing protein [Bacteriovoracaceae bacterium]